MKYSLPPLPLRASRYGPPCPLCNASMRRVRRNLLMRLRWGSKRYLCTDCQREFMLIRGELRPR